jgi:hypothetical protein
VGTTFQRSATAVALVAATLAVAGSPAHAGGSTIAFERPWYEPGELATGRVEFFSPGCCNAGDVDDDPYFLTMHRLDDTGRMADAPIPVGVLWIGWERSRFPPHPATWVAVAEFVVPDAPPGQYGISVANAEGLQLGAITGGWFHVGPPPPPAPPAPPPTAVPAPVPAVVTTEASPRPAAAELRAAPPARADAGDGPGALVLVTVGLVAAVVAVGGWRALGRRRLRTR